MPDVIVTVTNDGWFDDSSVIEHHLRCAQLVAVGCRRPILSAANNGPTAWIDSSGRVVDRLSTGSNGAIIATPIRDERTSLYVRMGDWPAKVLALVSLIALTSAVLDMRRTRRKKKVASRVTSTFSLRDLRHEVRWQVGKRFQEQLTVWLRRDLVDPRQRPFPCRFAFE